MNSMKQLLVLLRFQTAMNPFILFMPLVCAMPYALQLLPTLMLGGLFRSSLGMLVRDQISWLLPYIGVAILAPEAAWPGDSNLGLSNGLEFLLTRAVDRRLVLRARSVSYLLVILALPLAAYLVALKSPVLQIEEFDQAAYQEVFHRIPGSISAPKSDIIIIPNGNTLLESWRVWSSLCVAIGVQVFVYFIYPFKHRSYFVWGFFVAVLLVPITTILAYRNAGAIVSPSETLFLAFVARQPLFWLGTIAPLIYAQLWCENRFSRTEQ